MALKRLKDTLIGHSNWMQRYNQCWKVCALISRNKHCEENKHNENRSINLSTCSHVLNYEVKSNKLIDKQAHQHHCSFYNIIAQ